MGRWGSNPALFPTIGLDAGSRTPLAGVAFVAEPTGQPFFLLPALLTAAAQLVIGRWSFSSYQRAKRATDVEPLTRLTLADIMSSNADTIDADLNRVETPSIGHSRQDGPPLASPS